MDNTTKRLIQLSTLLNLVTGDFTPEGTRKYNKLLKERRAIMDRRAKRYA